MVFQKLIDNWLFIAPSYKQYHKYDVYNNRTGDYITSFGALKRNKEPYEQYDDRIGYYKQYNHYDLKRRERYRLRHKNDKINDPTSSGFFSWWFLW